MGPLLLLLIFLSFFYSCTGDLEGGARESREGREVFKSKSACSAASCFSGFKGVSFRIAVSVRSRA